MSYLYQLLDCGDKKKVEVFGDYKLIRPCPQALWKISKPEFWNDANAEFVRTKTEKGIWLKPSKNHMKQSDEEKLKDPILDDLPKSWQIESSGGLKWKIAPNEFGNVGVFTEHWMYSWDLKNSFDKDGQVLNLFSYTGSNSLDLVKAGFKVTAVDSSKNAMSEYAANLELNKLSREGQRLILEDVYKFISREIRREKKYSSILVDAPSFGRGTKGEVFNIEDDLVKLLETCGKLMEKDGKMVVTLHSPRFTPMILQNLANSIFAGKKIEVSEILNSCKSGIQLPSGFLVKVM